MLTNEIFFLEIVTSAILTILGVLLVYLLVRKTIDIRRRSLIERQKEKYHTFIYSNLMEGNYTRELIPKTEIQKIAIAELLSHYGKLLDGEREKDRLKELAEYYLSEYYRKLLKSRKWSYRMNALYHIEDFSLRSLLPDVNARLKKSNTSHEEMIHILKILASFQVLHLFELLAYSYNSFSEYVYRNILIRLAHHLFDHFVLGFHQCHQQLQYAILDVIAVKKELKYYSFIEKVFMSYSGEVKLRAVKTLAELGYVKDIDPYLHLLTSSKWEERMISARLIGNMRECKGLPQLIKLLHDSIWWVRSQAGQAIAKFPNGKEILQEVVETSEDPFARDMAWEWLHKGV
jgi:HEAT repeat protein